MPKSPSNRKVAARYDRRCSRTAPSRVSPERPRHFVMAARPAAQPYAAHLVEIAQRAEIDRIGAQRFKIAVCKTLRSGDVTLIAQAFLSVGSDRCEHCKRNENCKHAAHVETPMWFDTRMREMRSVCILDVSNCSTCDEAQRACDGCSEITRVLAEHDVSSAVSVASP